MHYSTSGAGLATLAGHFFAGPRFWSGLGLAAAVFLFVLFVFVRLVAASNLVRGRAEQKVSHPPLSSACDQEPSVGFANAGRPRTNPL